MSRDRRQVRSGIAALLAGALAIALLLVAPRLPQADRPNEGQPQPSAQALFEDAAARARSEGATAFEVPLEEGANPPGDTVFMRHRDLLADSGGIGARLSLSALATSAEQRMAVLDQLAAEATEPRIAYRIALERARLALRLGRAEDALAIALPLATGSDLPPLLTVDALFVAAHAALALGDAAQAEELLRRAVDTDPAFFNARQSHLILLASHLPRLARSDAACLEGARRLLEHAGALPSLAGSERRLFLDLADALSRLEGADHAARAFAAGVALSMAGDLTRARARLAAAARATGVLPPRCEAAIARAAELQLAALEDTR